VKAFVVILAALVFLAIAAVHGYRVYAGIPVTVSGQTVPMFVSWFGGGGAALLGLLLLVFGRK
jgi:hypothetical protein